MTQDTRDTLPQALADILAGVQRPGGFQVSGTFDLHPPRLVVDGVGPIALPLLPVQAQDLVRVAEQAPYGRGTETLVDTGVRRTWQIDAARVHLTGRRWAADLAEVVERVRTGLAVAGPIEAQLYKLLIYDTGSFFVSHRDTEKAPGMFATLVIVLPSDYSGGELIVRHRGEEVRIDLRRDEPSEAAFAAFYADCRHEVLPIASGHRLALIYNLVRRGEGPLPQAPDYSAEQARLVRLLTDWAGSADGPHKLIYPLEHAYTQAEIGFPALKGRDAAAAQVLAAAAPTAGCDLHLALIEVSESGWAEYTGGGRWDDPELEIGEVTDSAWTVVEWRRPDGTPSSLPALPFGQHELAPPDALADLDDAEAEFSEATGNEGASFERLYSRAALVLWPRGRWPRVLAESGIGIGVPVLMDLVRRWETAGASPGDARVAEARALADAIRGAWPTDAWERRSASEAKHTQDLLTVLLRLGALDNAADFIAEQLAGGAYGPTDNPALVLVLKQLPPERAADLLARLAAGNATRLPGACARLLLLYTDSAPERASGLGAAARALVQAIPSDAPSGDGDAPTGESRDEASTDWDLEDLDRPERREPLTAAHIADALAALARIDPHLAETATARLLADPVRYGMDKRLLPAALRLAERAETPEAPAVAALRRAVLDRLNARIALSLDPPADWTRESKIACTCTHCRSLAAFLASPAERVWQLKAAENDRRHVTYSVQRADCDLDLATDKRGRPYTLVCTKNRASWERAVKQRAADLAARERLGG